MGHSRSRSGGRSTSPPHRIFEGLDDEELVGVVATHYAEAQRATADGPERDALVERAREWLTQAGRRALALGSSEQALTYLERALELTGEGGTRAALLDLAGEAALHSDAFERSVAHYHAAAALHQSAGDLDAAGLSTARLTWALGDGLSRVSEAMELAEQFLAKLGETANERARADVAATLASLQSSTGASDEAPTPGLRWRACWPNASTTPNCSAERSARSQPRCSASDATAKP